MVLISNLIIYTVTNVIFLITPLTHICPALLDYVVGIDFFFFQDSVSLCNKQSWLSWN